MDLLATECGCVHNLRKGVVWLQVRGEVNKVLELARGGKLIGASLDARVYISAANHELHEGLQALSGSLGGVDNLSKIFLTSQVRSFPFSLFSSG